MEPSSEPGARITKPANTPITKSIVTAGYKIVDVINTIQSLKADSGEALNIEIILEPYSSNTVELQNLSLGGQKLTTSSG